MPPPELPPTSEPTPVPATASPPTATTPPPALHHAAGPGYVGEWKLFCDYTAATGHPALPTTVTALTGFLSSLPARPATAARRVRAIAAAHRRAGYLLARPDHGPTASATERPRPDPEAMIAACPTRGWPAGLHGRRDAFLVTLVDILGCAPHRARQCLPTDITISEPARDHPVLRIHSRPIPASDNPQRCAACALVRWLDILGILDGLGRGSARMALAAAEEPTRASAHQHLPTGPMRWQHAAMLLPVLDRHGGLDDYRPITTRTIRTRLAHVARRAHSGGNELAPDAAAPIPVARPATTKPEMNTWELDEVLSVLDNVADDADALNARIQALLNDHT